MATAAYRGDEHVSNTAGAAYQVRFSGTQAKLYTTLDSRNGIMAVSIDGGPEKLIDTYRPSKAYQQLVFTSDTLPHATHTLKARATGQKHAASSGTYIVADRADVTEPNTMPAPSNTRGSGDGEDSIFFAVCPVDHYATVDPIVYPGQKPVGHDHAFTANRTTDQNSTHDSLIKGRNLL